MFSVHTKWSICWGVLWLQGRSLFCPWDVFILKFREARLQSRNSAFKSLSIQDYIGEEKRQTLTPWKTFHKQSKLLWQKWMKKTKKFLCFQEAINSEILPPHTITRLKAIFSWQHDGQFLLTLNYLCVCGGLTHRHTEMSKSCWYVGGKPRWVE